MRPLLLLVTCGLMLMSERAMAAPACRTAADCQKACDAGKTAACVELGRRHELGDGVFRDEAVLQQVLGKACDKGEKSACVSLASVLLDEKGGWQKPLDALRGAALLQDACTAKHGPACELFAHALMRGKGLAKDPMRVVLLFQSACDLGQLGACAEVAVAFLNGAGVARDRERGVRLIEETCAKKGAAACRLRAELREKGLDGAPADRIAGLQLLEQACEQGDGRACDQLGDRHFRGTGVNVDKARAMKLYERACTLGFRSGCSPGNYNYDAAASLRLARLACDGGLKLYCRSGEYAPEGMKEVWYDVLERSCRLGNRHQCNQLRQEVLGEYADATELTRARRFFADACEGGLPSACDDLASAWMRDPGADPARAHKQLASFCAQGRVEACAARERTALQLKAEASLVRCQKKHDLAACAAAGEHFSTSGQWQKASPLLTRACDGKVWSACRTQARAILEGDYIDQQVEGEAYVLLGKACDGGDLRSCVDVAARDVAIDPQRGRKLYEKACAQEPGLCAGLIDELLSGRHLEQDVAGGLALLDQACARPGGKSICELAPRYQGAKDLLAHELACDAGDGARCFAAAEKATQARRPDLFERGCQHGHAESCLKSGSLRLKPQAPMPYDAPGALSRFAKGCEGGDLKACHQEGLLLLGGRGVTADPARSRAALERSCAAPTLLGCVELAGLLRDGAGGASEAARAATLFEQACRAGNRPSCVSAAELWRDGSAGPRNDAKARGLLSQGCQSGKGEKLACEYDKAITQAPAGGR